MSYLKQLDEAMKILRERESEFTSAFYTGLFAKYPDWQRFFANVPMEQQRVNLMASLILINESLRQPDQLEHYLEKLGRDHAKLDLTREHFECWIAHMVETMESFCRPHWSTKTEMAWWHTFQMAAETMCRAIEEVKHQPTG